MHQLSHLSSFRPFTLILTDAHRSTITFHVCLYAHISPLYECAGKSTHSQKSGDTVCRSGIAFSDTQHKNQNAVRVFRASLTRFCSFCTRQKRLNRHKTRRQQASLRFQHAIGLCIFQMKQKCYHSIAMAEFQVIYKENHKTKNQTATQCKLWILKIIFSFRNFCYFSQSEVCAKDSSAHLQRSH